MHDASTLLAELGLRMPFDLVLEASELASFAQASARAANVGKTKYSLAQSDLQFLARSLSAYAARLEKLFFTLSNEPVAAPLENPNAEINTAT